jgi:hypothetical protein
MSRTRMISSDKRYALFALLLWVQLVFGLSLTLWRHSLVLFSDWEVYPPYVAPEFDNFLALALDSCPAGSKIIYLSPGGDMYTSRFARLHYFLYPSSVEWWSPDEPLLPLDRWRQIDLEMGRLASLIEERNAACVLADGLEMPPIGQKQIVFDDRRSLFIFDPE